MLPGPLRTSVLVAAALATFLAGVSSLFAEARWAGTSISSAECRASDHGREDDSSRPVEECETEDQDDEDDRDLPLFLDAFAPCQGDLAIAFVVSRERRQRGSCRPSNTLVRGPPAAL